MPLFYHQPWTKCTVNRPLKSFNLLIDLFYLRNKTNGLKKDNRHNKPFGKCKALALLFLVVYKLLKTRKQGQLKNLKIIFDGLIDDPLNWILPYCKTIFKKNIETNYLLKSFSKNSFQLEINLFFCLKILIRRLL